MIFQLLMNYLFLKDNQHNLISLILQQANIKDHPFRPGLDQFNIYIIFSCAIIPMRKVYQIWPGTNRFLCAQCVSGPSRQWPGIVYIQFCSLILIIPISILVLPSNWEETPALPLIMAILFFIMEGFLLLTACSNPGFIPRRPFLQKQREKFKYLLQQNIHLKRAIFCQTCQIFRPPKASHCSTCQNCVQVFDHHCGIIGNCIGKRNYRFFVAFLASAFLFFITIITNVVVFVIKQSGTINTTVLIIILSVIGAIIGLPLLTFMIFHLYLAFTRKTTRQILKKIQENDIQYENQWCYVDEPIIDLYEDLSQSQANIIQEKIQRMRQPSSLGQRNDIGSSNKKLDDMK